jgi:hypothetical protein
MDIHLKRPAIAMVELIFAIVIMGIVLMSAPTLISTAASSVSVAQQQEGINEAASRVSMILTYPWDENDANDSCIPPVLHVTNGDTELNENGTSGRRVGVPIGTNSHTFKCDSTELDATAIGQEVPGTIDDIDDFTGTTINLVDDLTGAGGKDYIERTTVNIATTISYINDNAAYSNTSFAYAPGGVLAATQTSNIKHISVTLTSSSGVKELNKTIILRAFSCNIGGFEYESREL